MTGLRDSHRTINLILAISILRSSLKFMLSRVEHEKSFITSRPGRNLEKKVFMSHGPFESNYSKCVSL